MPGIHATSGKDIVPSFLAVIRRRFAKLLQAPESLYFRLFRPFLCRGLHTAIVSKTVGR
jgi:hypothetical protein